MPDNKLDLYKAYLADLGGIGNRYTTANGFYLSVLTALVAVLALTEGTKPLGAMRPGILICIACVAMVICWIWAKTITFYSELFSIKFGVLRRLEQSLSAQPFKDELDIAVERKLEGLTKNERRVPMTLGALFAVVAIVATLIQTLG